MRILYCIIKNLWEQSTRVTVYVKINIRLVHQINLINYYYLEMKYKTVNVIE